MQRATPTSGIFVGDGTLLIRCAELYLADGHEIAAIVTREPQVSRWASRRGLRQVAPDDDLVDAAGDYGCDYLFSIANLRVLGRRTIELPRKFAINFHDGPLPQYAGVNVTSWAVINQERAHAVTWHVMMDAVDAGPIVKQRVVDIEDSETAFSLNAKCYEAGATAFAELLEDIAVGQVVLSYQSSGSRTCFRRSQRPYAAGTLFFTRPAAELSALVRALDFGPYRNFLCRPKLFLGAEVIVPLGLKQTGRCMSARPGTVTGLDAEGLRVATATGEVSFGEFETLEGQPITLAGVAERAGLREGMSLPELGRARAARLDAFTRSVCSGEEFWVSRLATLMPLDLPLSRRPTRAGRPEYAVVPMSLPRPAEGFAEAHRLSGTKDVIIAVFAVYLARISGEDAFDLDVSEEALRSELDGLEGWYASQVPLRIKLVPSAPVSATLRCIADELAQFRKRKTYAWDLVARFPELAARKSAADGARTSIVIVESARSGSEPPNADGELMLVVPSEGEACQLIYDRTIFAEDTIEAMRRQIAFVFEQALGDSERPLQELSLLTPEERQRVLVEWNETSAPIPAGLCVHQAVERQVEKTPDAAAVFCRGEAVTYRELNERANRLAHHLVALGAEPDRLVGVYMERSLDMMVALLAILKAGAAYLPLDPGYPEERVSFMIEDAGVSLFVTLSPLAPRLPARAAIVCIDIDAGLFAENPASNFTTRVTADHLAYVIYTSGSTGTPKGVMVCHRNVINFFAGMDTRIPHDPPGIWLAVTGLSFDIAVLELFWTLARGFRVDLHAGAIAGEITADHASQALADPIDFSLFYFASDEGEGNIDKYRLLLEGATFADRNGFAAVWSPERHFHAFGGLYPNPSVASAAIAAVTKRIKIRAGSCVLPLHSPIRVAEEWALVDNLSDGRVGISFASGWQPDDFVIAPQNFADRKEAMFRDIDIVRRLWRGETIAFPGPTGKEVGVRTLPRPVQPELPVWITAAGNPETFRQAGELGANLLTHLLGQSVKELADKVTVYRQAWRDRGHAGDGHVTLMLHSFVGDDDDAVREIVRRPMKQYLRSSIDLIRRAAWTFPAFARRSAMTGKSPTELFDARDLSEAEMDTLLDHAFERYYETSGLFGTPPTCLKLVNKLKAIGIDEIACLVDFGVDSQQVLDHLDPLKTLKDLAAQGSDQAHAGIAARIRERGVTHLQCTPSLARVLLGDDHNRRALAQLHMLMIGGEECPAALAEELQSLVTGDVLNMYGPTETTVWSTTHRLTKPDGVVPLGRPICNTRIYVLDRNLQPMPPGIPGELFIGGAGVVRGYLNRPDLTRERFIPDPFDGTGQGRLYRTGDLVRYGSDGAIEFLGRLDHQVKIRGHRIELGEIEAVLARQPGVRQAVAVAREDEPGIKRLAGYVVATPGTALEVDRLSAAVRVALPEFMVPAHIVVVERMPLTPNGKIDRRALPSPQQMSAADDVDCVPPEDAVEARIATIWQDALSLSRVGRTDNFFRLGGDSLLAVAVHRKLCDAFGYELSIIDVFNAPTLADLAQIVRTAKKTATAPAPWSPLVEIASEGGGLPLFVIHGLTGVVVNLHALGLHVGKRRPVYGLQARGLDGVLPPFDRVEDMAAYYLSHVRRVQAHGPYLIAGFCFGGLVAFEIARLLLGMEEKVAFLGLMDSPFHPQFLTPLGQVRFRLAKQLLHARSIYRLSSHERLAYMRSRFGARLARMAPGVVEAPKVDLGPAARQAPRELQAVSAAAEQAFCSYEPRAYRGALTYFQPMIRDFRNILEFASEWRGKATDGVETVYVPGDHLTMLDEPAVAVLAEHLLERVDRASTPASRRRAR